MNIYVAVDVTDMWQIPANSLQEAKEKFQALYPAVKWYAIYELVNDDTAIHLLDKK